MKNHYVTLVAVILSLQVGSVYAYGSSSSSSSCDKPSYSDFKPSANKYLQTFREFSFVASSNTTASSIEVNISAGELKEHFSAKELQITPQKSGRLEVKGKLDKPFQHGFARISVTAHSKPGCEKTDGYLIRVQ
ncbi:MAG: hypothetical protein M0R33_12695 [Methylomonas sp.]|jgi:uncharacterized alpha/beta hydrolase family protein|uniref:hypothetical protein n=1 Tax=Methylomonas sp. TaxID=418 RepID=UPI0025FA5AB0|nr:hypothetical protein [Methylomonas sp.]MCK9607292.1 hypothetical protein [Methylomonas sp.]